MRVGKFVSSNGAIFVVAATVLFDGFARLVMTQVADVALDASGTWSFLEINALIQPFLDRKRKTYRIASHMLFTRLVSISQPI